MSVVIKIDKDQSHDIGLCDFKNNFKTKYEIWISVIVKIDKDKSQYIDECYFKNSKKSTTRYGWVWF